MILTTTVPCRALLGLIVAAGKAERMARFALDRGASRAFVTRAHGTVPGKVRRLLGLDDVGRDLMLLTLPTRADGVRILHDLEEQFHLRDKYAGVAFLQPVLPARRSAFVTAETSEHPYRILITIVDRGEGKTVVDLARRLTDDPLGASLVDALGGADHSRKVFDFEISPEKDLVIMLLSTAHCLRLQPALTDALVKSDVGRGVIFSFEAIEAAGLSDTARDESWDIEAVSRADHLTLLTFVRRGHIRDVVAAAESAGCTGATIIHGRNVTEQTGLLASCRDTERDLILFVIEPELKEAVVNAFRTLAESHPDYSMSVLSALTRGFAKLVP